MHSEFYMVEEDQAKLINDTKKNGGRVISVGTTSCRTLESATDENGILHAGSGWTEIFIYPGYKFKMIDGLITNFHLPESTLLMLVSALAGKEHIMAAYEEAVKERYRFFSFGDAIKYMKRGLKVARKGWNGKKQYIQLATGISYKTADGEIVNCEHDAIGNMAVAFVGTSGVQMGWLASQADMLAEDWIFAK